MGHSAVAVAFFFCPLSPELLVSGTASGCPSQPSCAVLLLFLLLSLLGGSDDKDSTCSSGGPGLIAGSGRSPGEGNGSPLQHSCLDNSMDRGALNAAVHEAAETWT